jgi:hypothetical protein
VVAKKILNHRRKKLDETYDVFEYFEEKRAALELVERHLLGLLHAPCMKPKSGTSMDSDTEQSERTVANDGMPEATRKTELAA